MSLPIPKMTDGSEAGLHGHETAALSVRQRLEETALVPSRPPELVGKAFLGLCEHPECVCVPGERWGRLWLFSPAWLGPQMECVVELQPWRRAARQAALSCSISFIKRIKEQPTVASSFGTSSPTHSVIGAITYVVCIYLKEERRMDLIDVRLSLESESKLLEFMNCISSIRGFLKYSVFVLFSLCGLTRSHVLIVFVFLRNVTWLSTMFPFHPAGLVSFCGFFGQENSVEEKKWHCFGCGSSFQPLLETTKRRVFFLYDITDVAAQVANQVRRLSGQVFFFYYYFSFPPCVRVCFALCCSDQRGRSLFFCTFKSRLDLGGKKSRKNIESSNGTM